jgi:uncharacterized protein YuzE
MKITYDKEADVLYIEFSDSKVVESEEKERNVVFEYDDKENLVGIEIAYFIKKYKKDFIPVLQDMETAVWEQLQAVAK